MLSRKNHFLSDVIRTGRLIRRQVQFNRKPSRRKADSRSMSAQIDTLEQRTLLTASPVGDQFLVNEALGFEGAAPAVAVQETTGDFVVAWAGFEQPPGGGSSRTKTAAALFGTGHLACSPFAGFWSPTDQSTGIRISPSVTNLASNTANDSY